MNIFKSNSVGDTEHLARCFSKSGIGGAIVFLSGPIGSGKTAFVQGLAKAMGMRELPASASFAIARSYGGTTARLYHFDLFRLKEEEVRECGYEDALADPDGVIAVEWPAPARDYFPQDRLELDFKLLAGGGRQVLAKAGGPCAAALLSKTELLWQKKAK